MNYEKLQTRLNISYHWKLPSGSMFKKSPPKNQKQPVTEKHLHPTKLKELNQDSGWLKRNHKVFSLKENNKSFNTHGFLLANRYNEVLDEMNHGWKDITVKVFPLGLEIPEIQNTISNLPFWSYSPQHRGKKTSESRGKRSKVIQRVLQKSK